MSGVGFTETITGPGASATVVGTVIFNTVTQIAVDAALAGNVTVGSGDSLSSTIFANYIAELDEERHRQTRLCTRTTRYIAAYHIILRTCR